MSTSVRAAAVTGYAVALGVLSADGWRWNAVLGAVAGLQALWVLGAWGSGRWLSAGRTGRGATLGAAFGTLAIATYYVYEALAHTLHAATAQLGASGVFWVPAAIVGGSVAGVVGALAARPPTGRAVEASAVGHVLMAAVLLAEPGWVLFRLSAFADRETLVAALAVPAVLSAALVVLAVRRSGTRAVLVAASGAALVVPVAGAAFLLVEHGFGYLTV